MFGHQTMFDGVWSPNIYRLSRPKVSLSRGQKVQWNRNYCLVTGNKQGVQTVKCLVTKQCLMVFGRQTFLVCPGPKTR